jgi:hypothetical protein
MHGDGVTFGGRNPAAACRLRKPENKDTTDNGANA